MTFMGKVLWAGLALAAVGTTQAQELRHGTVMALKPIDNRGQDESQTHQTGRQIGHALGGLFGARMGLGSGNAQVATVAATAAPVAGEAAGGAIAGQGPSAHYMVQVRLDDGKVIALVQDGTQVNGLAVGTPVAVSGEGSTARVTRD